MKTIKLYYQNIQYFENKLSKFYEHVFEFKIATLSLA